MARLAGKNAAPMWPPVGTVVTLDTYKQRKDVHGLAARGDRLNESTVRPMDVRLVKVSVAAEASGILVITVQGAKNDGWARSGGYYGSRSRVLESIRNHDHANMSAESAHGN